MVINVYAVKDSYLGFSMPILRDNDSVASRAFEFDCGLDNCPYITRPECYSLYRIGTYDTDTAQVFSEEPVFICSADNFIRKDRSDE